MLTPGEIVMSKPAVDMIGADNLLAMNAAGGGTNRPTVSGGYNKGGVVTDPEEKKQQEAYMLKYVNEERALQGLKPLKKLSYAQGVELTKGMGSEYYGGGIKETSDTDMNFDTMTKTTWKTKSRGSEIIFQGATETITEEQKQAYLDSNPVARMAMELKDQAEMGALGADISASAKKGSGYRGGGLVLGFQGGGQVRKNAANIQPKKTVKNITPSRRKKTTVAYQDQGGSMKSAGGTGSSGNKEIPSFSATAMRSSDKIDVLGISV